jgi:anaphase-promoting complex subunit 3
MRSWTFLILVSFVPKNVCVTYSYSLGVPLRTSNIFKMTDEMRAYLSIPASAATPGEPIAQPVPLQPHVNGGNIPNTPIVYDPFNPTRTAGDPGLNHGGPNFMSRLNGTVPPLSSTATSQSLDWDTPITAASTFEDDVLMVDDTQLPIDSEAPAAPVRKKGFTNYMSDMMDAPKMKTIATRNRPKTSADTNGEGESSRPTSLPVSHKRSASGKEAPGNSSASSDAAVREVRRSTRLQSGPSSRLGAVFNKYTESREKRELPKVRATGTKGRATTSTVGRNVSGNRRLEPGQRDNKESRPTSAASSIREPISRRHVLPPIESPPQEQEALQWLLDLCAKLGEGYYELSRYRCQSALQIFQSVGTSQRETPWVLAQIGRAQYERSAYAEAGEVFAKIKKIAPSRMEDMEVYSTVLWHLKDEMDLAYLSHELLESDRLAPQAWCAIGNSFSLQREHDQAVKCFKRATQLDPKFAYGYTLQGHEHVANEEFDKALHAYRCAIGADNRHYNGWYGLGQVYEKLGKYEVAEKHYKSAMQINSTNPVLAICIGLVCA